MSRVLRTMPWLYATVAFAVGAVTLVAGSIPDPAWRVAVVIVGTSAAMIGWFVHRLPFIFMFGLAVTTARRAGLHVGNNDDPLADLTIGHAVSDLAVGLAVGAMLAAVLWRRHGRFLAH